MNGSTNSAMVAVRAPASTTPAIPKTTEPTRTIGINNAPIHRPGMMPLAKRAPTEMPPALAKTIIVIEVGIIPPMVELTAVIAAANAGG